MSAVWVRETGGRLPTHVYPINDLRDHETNGAPCWCEPEIEDTADETIVVHHSLDGREKFETGERKSS